MIFFKRISLQKILIFFLVTTIALGAKALFFGNTYLRTEWQNFLASCCQGIFSSFTSFLISSGHRALLATLFLIGSGLIFAVYSLFIEIWRSARLERRLRAHSFSASFTSPNIQVYVPNDERSFACTIGFFRPTIYLSKGILQHCTPSEITAILTHEKIHQEEKHPLRTLLLRSLLALWWYIPARELLLKKMELAHEFAADNGALKEVSPHTLGSALLKIISTGGTSFFSTSTTAAFSTLEARIDRLTNSTKATPHSFRQIGYAIFAVIASILLFAQAFIPLVFARQTPSSTVHQCTFNQTLSTPLLFSSWDKVTTCSSNRSH